MRKKRFYLFIIIAILITIGVLSRFVWLQVLPNEKLSKIQKKQFETAIRVQPRRGEIVDRLGRELAISIAAHSLFADPKMIENPRIVSKRLSRVLGLNQRVIYKKIKNKKRRFVWIERRLSKDIKVKIQKWNLRGLGFVEESKRIYPNETLLSQVLGFVGSDERGLEGLEGKYNSHLKGEKKKITLLRDARGRPLLSSQSIAQGVPEGMSLELTIDREIQYQLEQELAEAIKRHSAESAMGIILDAKTSEIVSMASLPSFNPNHPFSSDPKNRRNRLITDLFEPGSTLKTFTMAGGIKYLDLKPNSKIDCEEGDYEVGGRKIGEADKKHTFGIIPASEVLAHSSNIGSAKVALELGDKRLKSMFKSFGLVQKTDIDFWGEGRGILPELPWRDHRLCTVAFGQGIAVTPLQVANAYAAIANGGVLQKPYIVKALRDPLGVRKIINKPKKIRRVLTKEQNDQLVLMLMSVAQKGFTGELARVRGFPVAGKTGTAQIPDNEKGGYKRGAYLSSFAGFVPANDPKYVIWVAVENPQKGYYASKVAAPIFRKIATFAINKSGLEPVLLSEKNLLPQGPPKRSKKIKKAVAKVNMDLKRVPNWKGLSLRTVLQQIKDRDLKIEIYGSGKVTHTKPSMGQLFKKEEPIQIYLKPMAQK